MTVTMFSGRCAIKAEILAVFLLLASLFVLTTACNNKGAEADTPPVAMSAAEIAEAAIAAQAGLDSFRFDVDVNVTVSGKTPGWATANTEGAVDQAQERMRASMSAILDIEESEPGQIGVEVYLVDDVAYLKIELPEMPGLTGTWVKVPAAEEPWSQQDMYAKLTDLLRDAVEVESLGTEMVGEAECHKLRITPDIDKLLAWVTEQPGIVEQVPDTELEDVVFDLSMVSWVATDTFIPLKESIDGTITFKDDIVEVHITSQMHDINEPVTIELPPEAAAAREMPLLNNIFGGDGG